MTSFGYLGLFVLGLLTIGLLVGCLIEIFGAVPRGRVKRFAVRQALVITPGNGNQVIGYLATTRRWRGGLLFLMLVASCAYFLVTSQRLKVDGAAIFSGWFAGAVVAEWRVGFRARDLTPTASLHRRRIQDYVPKATLQAATAVCLVTALLSIAAFEEALRRSTDRSASTFTFIALCLVDVTIASVARRILYRPQSLTDLDLLDADQAIRGRALHVLAGSATAISGYFAAISLDHLLASTGSGAASTAHAIGFVVLPIAGALIACMGRPAVQRSSAQLLST